jgi:hypothetical protein
MWLFNKQIHRYTKKFDVADVLLLDTAVKLAILAFERANC